MMAGEAPLRSGLRRRWIFMLLASVIGIGIGWNWKALHSADAAFALVMAVGSATVCIELLRLGPDRKLWLVSPNMGCALVFMFMFPHTRLQAFAGVATWIAASVASICRRRRAALWCVVVCAGVVAIRVAP